MMTVKSSDTSFDGVQKHKGERFNCIITVYVPRRFTVPFINSRVGPAPVTCKRTRRRRREGTHCGGDAATAAEGEVSAQTVAKAA